MIKIPKQEKSECAVPHPEHDTLQIELHLLGKHHGISDVAGVAPHLESRMLFTVFNWRLYSNTHGYCPGDDVVSYSIFTQGIWEGFETALFLDVLYKEKDSENKLVLDFGANMGWFSVLAGIKGFEVFAYECDPDILRVLEINVANNCPGKVIIVPEKVDENSEQLELIPEKTVTFLKCDIEGMDRFAFQKTKNLFKNKQIKYAMFEISPVFNDSYPQLMQEIQACGYRVFRIATKGCTFMDEYEAQPLATLKKYCEVNTLDWFEYLKTIEQDDFIFIRDDLV